MNLCMVRRQQGAKRSISAEKLDIVTIDTCWFAPNAIANVHLLITLGAIWSLRETQTLREPVQRAVSAAVISAVLQRKDWTARSLCTSLAGLSHDFGPNDYAKREHVWGTMFGTQCFSIAWTAQVESLGRDLIIFWIDVTGCCALALPHAGKRPLAAPSQEYINTSIPSHCLFNIFNFFPPNSAHLLFVGYLILFCPCTRPCDCQPVVGRRGVQSESREQEDKKEDSQLKTHMRGIVTRVSVVSH